MAIWNALLLGFNLLPVYPLDGGQIVQSLLWFVIGQAKSLLIVSVMGLAVAAVAIVVAISWQQYWWVVMAVFVAIRAWSGFQQAKLLARMAEIRRNADAACPHCHMRPPVGDYWPCDRCRNRFDLFANGGVCPNCQAMFPVVPCPDCQRKARRRTGIGLPSGNPLHNRPSSSTLEGRKAAANRSTNMDQSRRSFLKSSLEAAAAITIAGTKSSGRVLAPTM